ncbi:MAG: hypothetical protein J0I29_13765 [Rhizobiales bacterium]|nr:hypothetical protein [Hyphomicrobiales bacterium]
MPISIFLAKLIGPTMIVIGLAVILHQEDFRKLSQEFISSRALLFLSGLIILPAGIAILIVHNVWRLDWRVLITIMGWLLTVGGAVRLLAPRFVAERGNTMLKHPQMPLIAGIVWATIGFVLFFYGYR